MALVAQGALVIVAVVAAIGQGDDVIHLMRLCYTAKRQTRLTHAFVSPHDAGPIFYRSPSSGPLDHDGTPNKKAPSKRGVKKPALGQFGGVVLCRAMDERARYANT